jgi:1,4-dihydroxy-2-naphthoate octaprenyltransferase
MPVYFFALSQAGNVSVKNAISAFVVWHLFIYPASNGYNSFFDKDEGSIALVKTPPKVDLSLYCWALIIEAVGILLAVTVSLEFALSALLYGLLSKAYSHPAVRLKKYPVISFLVVFIFQGAFVYWATIVAISEQSITTLFNTNLLVAGSVCSCLIGASYPLTQVYQHEEDSKRGDRTLSLLLGINGSFVFSAVLFAAGTALLFGYWKLQNELTYFWIFVGFAVPVFGVFLDWLFKVLKNPAEANFKNMMRMTLVSGLSMLLYFLLLCFIIL